MLNTRETVDELARAGIGLTPDEVATLARLEIFLDAQKDASGQWQIPQESIEVYIQQRKQKKRLKWITTGSLLTVFTVFLAIISSTKDGLDLISEYLPFHWFNATDIQPAEENEILIVIAPFYGDGSLQPEAWIEKELVTQIEDIDALSDVRVERYHIPIGGGNHKAEVENLTDVLNPSIIIWGRYDEVGIIANFEITRFNEFQYQAFSPTLPEALRSNSDPDRFTLFIAKELPEEVSHLVFFTIGQLYILKKDAAMAQYFFEVAVKNLPTHFSRFEEVSLVRTVTLAQVIGFNDFDYGLSVAQCLRELDPDLAQNILSNIYPLKAVTAYLEENNYPYVLTAQLIDGEQVLSLRLDKEVPLEAWKSDEAFDIFEEERANSSCVHPSVYFHSGIQNYLHGNVDRGIFDLQLLLTQIEPGVISSQAQEFLNMMMSEIEDEDQRNYLSPTTASAYHGLGLEYAKLCDYEEAIVQYTNAIEIDDEYASAYLSRGGNYSDIGKYELALQDYEKAIQIDPEDPQKFIYRGITYMKLDENEKAIEDFEHAYRLTDDEELKILIDGYLYDLQCSNEFPSEALICQSTPLAGNNQASETTATLEKSAIMETPITSCILNN